MKIVKKHNIELIITDDKLEAYKEDGFVYLKDFENKGQPPTDGETKALKEMKKEQLKAIAKELEIASYSSLTAEELIAAIKQKQSGDE